MDPNHKSMRGRNTSLYKKQKKRDISSKQFDYIYKNKIETELDAHNEFKFEDMNVLLNAYEYWQYENKNKQAFKEIDDNVDIRESAPYKRRMSLQPGGKAAS